MASLRHATLSAPLLLAALAGACTGQLGLLGDEHDTAENEAPTQQEEEPLRLSPMVVSRLTRLEYNNTVRDLFGTQLTPADDFPADGTAEGFDTVGSALSLSPLHVVAYERAAHELVTELFATESEARQRIIHCDVDEDSDDDENSDDDEDSNDAGASCARSILSAFAKRAWRRPVTDEEIDAVMTPFRTAQEVGASRLEGIQHSLAAVLMSPFFIFKLEPDDDPTSTEPRPLTPYELASRLSYTLWSTLPDDELLAAAEAGDLNTDEGLSAQIDRMLDDPRSDALLHSFAGRWLEFEDLEMHEVSSDLFPEFNADIARSMKREAQWFIRDFLHSGRPASELLTAGFTYVDAPLASYYGISFDQEDPESFVRVDTAGSDRSGLLTLGALLTLTSFSSRTSVVRRGEFVFSRILCQEIPPPPPGVEGISMDDSDGLTLRQRLERHREDPACFGCHALMDPLGFGLESYDAIGRYRTHEGSLPVDASGELPDGTAFDGATELSQILSQDQGVSRCITKKFLVYAGKRLLHHGNGSSARNDARWVEHLKSRAEDMDGGSLRGIIRAVLLSEPFRNRVPNSG